MLSGIIIWYGPIIASRTIIAPIRKRPVTGLSLCFLGLLYDTARSLRCLELWFVPKQSSRPVEKKTINWLIIVSRRISSFGTHCSESKLNPSVRYLKKGVDVRNKKRKQCKSHDCQQHVIQTTDEHIRTYSANTRIWLLIETYLMTINEQIIDCVTVTVQRFDVKWTKTLGVQWNWDFNKQPEFNEKIYDSNAARKIDDLNEVNDWIINGQMIGNTGILTAKGLRKNQDW